MTLLSVSLKAYIQTLNYEHLFNLTLEPKKNNCTTKGTLTKHKIELGEEIFLRHTFFLSTDLSFLILYQITFLENST